MNNKRTVPFFPYSALFSSQQKELTSLLQEVLGRGAFILQKDLQEFEKNLSEYLRVKHVIGLANATDALTLALRAAGIRPGDEVIISSHTFIATAAAIHFAGGVPVPVECGPDHLIDPQSVEDTITSKTRFLMPTQLNGRTCNMDPLQEIADKHHLTIIEDSAQGLGSRYKGKFAGTFGKAGVLSFYPAKILGCFGDGGALMTDDDEIARRVRLMRDHGRDESGNAVLWGVNSRLDNIQAAVLNYFFRDFEKTVARRREIARIYQDKLGSLSQIVLPPPPEKDEDHFDTFQNFEIEAERRDELRAFLKEKGIGTLIQWGGKAVHQMRGLGFRQELPATDKLFGRLLMLPMNSFLTDEDTLAVCERIQEFYRS